VWDGMSRVRVIIDGVLDWRMDLLITWTHDSWLHLMISPSLISGLIDHYSKSQDFSVRCVFTSRSLVMASNIGDSSASAFTSLSASSHPHQVSLFFTDSVSTLLQLTVTNELTSKFVSVIRSWLGPCRKHCLLLYSGRFPENVFVCEGVTQ
jgi:hypothetical protein